MKICDVLTEDNIIPELKSVCKVDTINELIDIFKDDERVLDLTQVKNSVMEREKIMSTGVGHGFGIPHCKTNKVTEILAAFGKTKEPIDFEALDGEPVSLFFLLIGKDNLVAPHIKLLSRISLLMNKEEV
jgi:mannitol/fructose-specific phosphotransferase system IIA component (Ntr-type)